MVLTDESELETVSVAVSLNLHKGIVVFYSFKTRKYAHNELRSINAQLSFEFVFLIFGNFPKRGCAVIDHLDLFTRQSLCGKRVRSAVIRSDRTVKRLFPFPCENLLHREFHKLR